MLVYPFKILKHINLIKSAFKRLNSSDSRQSADKHFLYVEHFM